MNPKIPWKINLQIMMKEDFPRDAPLMRGE